MAAIFSPYFCPFGFCIALESRSLGHILQQPTIPRLQAQKETPVTFPAGPTNLQVVGLWVQPPPPRWEAVGLIGEKKTPWAILHTGGEGGGEGAVEDEGVGLLVALRLPTTPTRVRSEWKLMERPDSRGVIRTHRADRFARSDSNPQSGQIREE